MTQVCSAGGTNAQGNQAAFTYDPNGNLLSVKDFLFGFGGGFGGAGGSGNGGAILWYGNEPRKILTGAAYLTSAAVLDLFCLFNVLAVKPRLKTGHLSQSAWLLQTRSQVVLLAGWQLAVMGLLNIWSTETSRLLSILLLSNALAAVSIFTWDRLIAIADNPSQDGGAKSLGTLGRQRSRRLFFWAFFVYPLSSLVIADVMIFVNGKNHPSLFNPPQICLLLDALFVAGATGLIFQRYRKVATGQAQQTAIFLVGLLIGGAAVGSRLLVGWNPYCSLLSMFILLCTTICTYLLWRARNSSLPSLAK